jgi:hypothetical protein
MIRTAPATSSRERARQAGAWLNGFAAGYRGHPMHVPFGFDVRRWLDGSDLPGR